MNVHGNVVIGIDMRNKDTGGLGQLSIIIVAIIQKYLSTECCEIWKQVFQKTM